MTLARMALIAWVVGLQMQMSLALARVASLACRVSLMLRWVWVVVRLAKQIMLLDVVVIVAG